MGWREREDLWNGVVSIHPDGSPGAESFVAFCIVAPSREVAASKLYIELLDRGWTLVSFVNLQGARSVDDEAAGHLDQMAIECESHGVAFSSFPASVRRTQ